MRYQFDQQDGAFGQLPPDLVPEVPPPGAGRRRRRARLKAIVAEVGAEVIEIEVIPDHVHLLAELPPTVPLEARRGMRNQKAVAAT
jgi:Transposase IS200 like